MSEALNSIFSALCTEDAAGLLVPELATPVRILDLAKFLIGDKDVPIVFTGLRPGDKMEESLTSQRESYRNLSGSTLRTVQSPVPEPEELANGLDDLQSALEQRNLPHLVAAVQHLVPEYQPTTQIRKGAAAVAAVNV
jgi:FlaA1/EpsC-like NDP-sugar epimerase